MIPKVLFLALFCASYVQCRPASSPQSNRSVENHSSVSNSVRTYPPVAELHIDASIDSDNGNPVEDDSTDVSGEDHANENLNDGQNKNSNANVNRNEDDVSTHHSSLDVNGKVTTQREAINDNANDISIHHREPTSSTEKMSTVKPVTERTQKPAVETFVTIFGQAINDVVQQNVHNFHKEGESVVDVGQSVMNAAQTMVDAKMKFVKSLPRVGESFFEALGKM